MIRGALAAALLCAGCVTGLHASYWMPHFSNETSSGSGSDLIDIQDDLGIETGNLFVFEIQGEAGRQRGRLGYWQVTGEGSSTVGAGGFNFANHTYQAGDQTESEMDLAIISAVWEPGIVQTPRFRLGISIGVNMLQFNLVADDLTNPPAPGDGEVHVPSEDSDLSSIGYMPVPVAGLGIDVGIKPWLWFVLRGEAFDTDLVPLVPDVDALFYGGQAGFIFGRAKKHIIGFAGYRYYHAEYTYDTDTGDSTLNGPIAGLTVIF